MQFSEIHPPLRAWPSEAFADEPAHGFFVRLAARNGAHSTAVFADAVGLNGRNPDPDQLTEYCLRFPFRGHDTLIAGSPSTDGNHILLNGQRFHKARDWSMGKPRVCDACLGENRYYRNWWDLAVVSRCPIHDRPLLDGNGISRLSWRYPNIGQTADGHDLIAQGVARAESRYQSWDRYVLGRMGIVAPIVVPSLDECDLCAVIDVADLIGRAVRSGWGRAAPRRPKPHSEERRSLLSLAFQVLTKDGAGLDAFLCTYLGPDARARRRRRSEPFFGWFATSLNELEVTPLTAALRASMDRVAATLGVYRKRGPNRDTGGLMTLKDLTRMFGIGTVPLLRIAVDLGIAHRTRNKQLRHWFDDHAVALMRNYLDSLVLINDARAMLGCSPEEFASLMSIGSIKSVVRRERKFYFSPEAIRTALERMHDCDVAKELLSKLRGNRFLREEADAFGLVEKLHPHCDCMHSCADRP
jgi:hypothetical protein